MYGAYQLKASSHDNTVVRESSRRISPEIDESMNSSGELLDDCSDAHSSTYQGLHMSDNIASKLNKVKVSSDDVFLDSTDSTQNDAQTSSERDEAPASTSSSHVFFPTISCLPFENNIVFCFVLSVWDNIVGPHTALVWKRNNYPSKKVLDDLHASYDMIKENKAKNRKARDEKLQKSSAYDMKTAISESYSSAQTESEAQGRSKFAETSLQVPSSRRSSAQVSPTRLASVQMSPNIRRHSLQHSPQARRNSILSSYNNQHETIRPSDEVQYTATEETGKPSEK